MQLRKLYRNLLRAESLVMQASPVYAPSPEAPTAAAEDEDPAAAAAREAEERRRVEEAVEVVAEMELTAEQIKAGLRSLKACPYDYKLVFRPEQQAAAAEELDMRVASLYQVRWPAGAWLGGLGLQCTAAACGCWVACCFVLAMCWGCCGHACGAASGCRACTLLTPATARHAPNPAGAGQPRGAGGGPAALCVRGRRARRHRRAQPALPSVHPVVAVWRGRGRGRLRALLAGHHFGAPGEG